MNKLELTGKINTSREQLESLLAQVSAERMSLLILHGEWSVKDLIGHLGFWENRIMILYKTLKAGGTPEPSPELDLINAQALAELRTQSLSEVRRLEKTSYQRVLALVNDASDSELFDPNYFPWTEGKSFEQIISDNTWGHYQEHLPELNAWLKRVA